VNTSLTKSSVYTLSANVLLAASNWLLLVVIAKQFSTLELGQFVLVLSITSPAFLFASFKVRTLLVVDRQWDFSLEEYASARLLANAVVTILIMLVITLNWPELAPVAGIVLLYKWCDSWTEFCHSYQRRLQRFTQASLLLSSRSCLSIFMVIGASLLGLGFIWVLLLWALVTVLFTVLDSWFFYTTSGQYEPHPLSMVTIFSWRSVKRAFVLYRRYFTVACALIISSLFVYLPNFFLSKQLNVEAAGQFAAISYFLVAGGIIINSLSQVVTPKLSIYFQQQNERDFSLLVKQLCWLGLLLGIAGLTVSWFFGEFFLRVFYTPQIAEYSHVLNWVMLAAAVRYIYIFIGTAMASMERFAIQTKIYACGLVAMFVACYILIPEYGVLGAAQAMLIATLVELGLFVLVVKSQVRLAFTFPKVKMI
jgi:O-antigen/teichoic acid export membrane protein